MIYCSNCGTANRDGSRFCNECGMRLGTPITCSSCGAENVSTARFCSNCGNPVSPVPTNDVMGSKTLVNEDDEPLESDVPAVFEDDNRSSIAESQPVAEAIDFDDFGEVEERTDSPVVGQVQYDDLFKGDIENELTLETTPMLPEAEDLRGFISWDEACVESGVSSDTRAPNNGSLPSWLYEDEESNGSLDAILVSGELDVALDDTAHDDCGSGIKGNGAGIILSKSLVSGHRSASAAVDVLPLTTNAGQVFAASLCQPWQALQAEDRPTKTGIDKGNNAKSAEKGGSTKLLFLLLFLLLLSISVVSFIYVTRPDLQQNTSDLGPRIQQEATNLFSRFIK